MRDLKVLLSRASLLIATLAALLAMSGCGDEEGAATIPPEGECPWSNWEEYDLTNRVSEVVGEYVGEVATEGSECTDAPETLRLVLSPAEGTLAAATCGRAHVRVRMQIFRANDELWLDDDVWWDGDNWFELPSAGLTFALDGNQFSLRVPEPCNPFPSDESQGDQEDV